MNCETAANELAEQMVQEIDAQIIEEIMVMADDLYNADKALFDRIIDQLQELS